MLKSVAPLEPEKIHLTHEVHRFSPKMASSRLLSGCTSPNHQHQSSLAFSDNLSQTSTTGSSMYPLLSQGLRLHANLASSSSDQIIYQSLADTNRDIVALSAHDPHEGHSREDGNINQESVSLQEGEEDYQQNTDQSLTRTPGLVLFAAAPSEPSPRVYVSTSRAQCLEFASSDQGLCDTPAPQDGYVLTSPSPGCTSDGSHPTLTSGDDTITSQVVGTRALSEQDRIEERNRKGRARSLRTRNRNANRLRLLQENCLYLSRENEMLREILRIWEQKTQWGPALQDLLDKLEAFTQTRPEPYVPGGV